MGKIIEGISFQTSDLAPITGAINIPAEALAAWNWLGQQVTENGQCSDIAKSNIMAHILGLEKINLAIGTTAAGMKAVELARDEATPSLIKMKLRSDIYILFFCEGRRLPN